MEIGNIEDVCVRWDDNIRMDLTEIAWEDVGRIVWFRIGISRELL
jgi:hypothetical protein